MGSSAPLRRLGAEIRRLREEANLTQSELGAALGRTHASLVNWERGKTKISKSDLVCLLAELRAPAEVRKALEQLREEASQGHSQWAVYGLPSWLRPLLSFEEDAVEVCAFEPVVVPGLLQTEEYARATHLATPHVVARADVDRWAAARMQRQRRLSGKRPLKFRAVIAEAVLRLQVGGPAAMAGQLRRLVEAGRSRNITIRVLPASVGAHHAMASNLAVLHFADPKVDPPLGYFDGPLGGTIISDEGDVATMIKMFRDVRDLALSETDSAVLLGAILDEHPKEGLPL